MGSVTFQDFSDVEKLLNALKTGQYFDGNREYKLMRNYFSTLGNKKLTYDHSIRFKDEKTLTKHGLIKSIF